MNIPTTGRTLQLLRRIFDTRMPTEPFYTPSQRKASLPLRTPKLPFERATPESEGISSAHIRTFLDELGRNSDLYMQNVLILRNGKVLCSASYGAQDINAPKYTFSACKSITSLAVGLLSDDGALHLDSTVGDLFEDILPPSASRRLRCLTVEDLLTMRSGISFSELQSATEPEWLHTVFTTVPTAAARGEFRYNSLNSYLLSVIVFRVAGEGLSSFLQRRLFDPMGITDTFWELNAEGFEKGGWGLYIRPEDIAKIGQLVMNGGMWKGKRLISENYLSAATSSHVSPPPELGNFDYGYHIWVGRNENSFLFNGMLGQNVLGFRDSGIIIVTNAGADTDYQQSKYFEIVSRYFSGRFPTSLPSNPDAFKEMQTYVKELSYYCHPKPVEEISDPGFFDRCFSADDPNAVSTGLFPVLLQILHNNFTKGIQSLSVTGSRIAPVLLYREQDESYCLPIGLQKPLISELSFHGNLFRIAAHGRFTHDEEERPVFYIRLDFLETPSVRILKLVLTEGGLILRQSETPGGPYLLNKLRPAAQHPLFRPLIHVAAGGSDEDYLRFKVDRLISPNIRMSDADTGSK